MAKVALDGTINMQGTKEIDRTNLAQLREPATTWLLAVVLILFFACSTGLSADFSNLVIAPKQFPIGQLTVE